MGYLDMIFPGTPVAPTDETVPGKLPDGSPLELTPEAVDGKFPDTPQPPSDEPHDNALPDPGTATPPSDETPPGKLPTDPPAPMTGEPAPGGMPGTPASVSPQLPPCDDTPTGLVVNGDFELPDVTGGTTFTTGQDVGGWLVETGDVRVYDSTDAPNIAIEGQSILFLNDSATIKQSVVTEVGKQYHVQFAGRHAEGDWNQPTGFSISVKGTTLSREAHWVVGAPTAGLVFTADSTSTEIALQWTPGVVDAKPAIDNVRIY